jgi:glycosyltransferase involved in cell wall biosynthesis
MESLDAAALLRAPAPAPSSLEEPVLERAASEATTPAVERSSDARPFVSVVVPVYDHGEHLPEALLALADQTYSGEWEIVVVDNGSCVGLEATVASHPRARLVHEARVGSYAARNRGVQEARGEVLAFTDADCRPEPSWLAAGTEALLADPACGLIAGRIDVEVRDPRRPTAAELYESVAAFSQREYVERWRFGATANLFTRREVFARVGPFDESLYSLGDRDWGRRVFEAGFAQRYAEVARVRHPARRSVGELLRRARRMAGGYYQIARSRRVSPKTLLRDAPMGLVSRLGLGSASRSRCAAPGRRQLEGLGERATVAMVTLAIVAVRALELGRLLAGGRPRRA